MQVYCALPSSEPPPRCQAAGSRLTQLLLQASQLQATYTHHPSLLYWAFQAAGVPTQLQQLVLEQWLGRHESPSTLLGIVRTKRDAVHPLLVQ